MPGEPVCDSCKCCSTEFYEVDSMPFTDSEEEDDEEELEQLSAQPTTSTAGENLLPVKNLLLKQTTISPVTPIQEERNRELLYLKDNVSLTVIHDYLEENLTALYTEIIGGNIKPDNAANGIIFSNLTSKINNFLMTTLSESEYLPQQQLDPKYHKYIRQMLLDMASELFDREAKKAAEKTIVGLYTEENRRPQSDAGRGVIRRVAGRAVYLAKKETDKKLKTLIKNNRTISAEYRFLKQTSTCLQSVRVSEDAVITGEHPETATETSRRHYSTAALTLISDKMFEYFLMLETKRDTYQSIGAALLHGNAVIRNTYHTLNLDLELDEKLKLAIPTTADNGALRDSIRRLLFRKYLPVGNNQFRKVLVSHFEKTRRLAHRPQVAASEQTASKKRVRNPKIFVRGSPPNNMNV